MTWLGLGVGVQLLADAVVGVRLLLLGRRTRKLPELCFGACSLLLGGLGLPLAIAGRTRLEGDPVLAAWLVGSGLAIQDAACAALYLGTWRVFRPGSRLAAAAVGLAGLALAASVPGQAWTAGYVHATGGGAWYWIGFAARAGAFLWSTAESLRYARLLGRRARLGLAEPVVVDRFRLWALCCGAVSGGFGLYLLSHLSGVNPATSAPVLALTSVIGVIAGAALWLAFAPPRAYLRRFARSPRL